MLLGFVAYGLSINFYIMAQKDLGVAKTSAYYAISPFLGVAFSMIFVGERPQPQFYIALIIMTASTVLMIKDSIALQHTDTEALSMNISIHIFTLISMFTRATLSFTHIRTKKSKVITTSSFFRGRYKYVNCSIF